MHLPGHATEFIVSEAVQAGSRTGSLSMTRIFEFFSFFYYFNSSYGPLFPLLWFLFAFFFHKKFFLWNTFWVQITTSTLEEAVSFIQTCQIQIDWHQKSCFFFVFAAFKIIYQKSWIDRSNQKKSLLLFDAFYLWSFLRSISSLEDVLFLIMVFLCVFFQPRTATFDIFEEFYSQIFQLTILKK